MAPTSAAERKRKSRAEKKEELGLEEYRKQQRQYIANYRSSRTVTPQQREKEKMQNRDRVAKHRELEKRKELSDNDIEESADSLNVPECTLNRSISKSMGSLPQSPRHRIKVVKRLAKKFTPMSMKRPIARRVASQLAEEIIDMVLNFYKRSDIAYQTPGQKDSKTVSTPKSSQKGCKKEKKQKLYLRYSLMEAYKVFTAENPEVKVSFSKFYALKPEEVLLRHQTPASLCFSEYHANVKLLIDESMLFRGSLNPQQILLKS